MYHLPTGKKFSTMRERLSRCWYSEFFVSTQRYLSIQFCPTKQTSEPSAILRLDTAGDKGHHCEEVTVNVKLTENAVLAIQYSAAKVRNGSNHNSCAAIFSISQSPQLF
jgi:hypothetical protein